MLQSPLAPTAPASQAPPMFPPSAPAGSPLTGAEPGEFTKMLQSPIAPSPNRPSAPPPSMFPPSSPGGLREPGEFTRMLNSPGAPEGLVAQPLAAPPPRPQPTGEATRAFQAQQGQAQAGAPAQQGPSEFTKMFKAPPPAPPAAPEPKAVKKPAGRPPIPKKKTNYLLYILIAAAVVLALALVIYLIVR
jgi:hypothetical protein